MKSPTTIQPKFVLKKTKAIKDCATGNWAIEFEFVQEDGKKARVLVPTEDADTARSLARCLKRKGARLPQEASERKSLLDSVIAAAPEKIVHQIANAGWQLGTGVAPWMCIGRRLFGPPNGTVEYAPPLLIAQSLAKGLKKSGTLEDWRTRVAKTAVFSTCLTIGIVSPFAAALLSCTGLQNFALHVFGPSRAGKTTTLIAAMSVVGLGREEDLPNWNASGARLLQSASAFCDIVFPLNEVGAARGKRNETYEGLRNLYTQLAEGHDRHRHPSWEALHGPSKRFRVIAISTAEHSVSEYAGLAGEARDGGELFRAIDVPAVREGKDTILDRAPEKLDQRACLQQLRVALTECHGTAFPPYLEFLTRMGAAQVKRRASALVQEFVGRMAVGRDDGVARQLATNFGLLYAGGVLGIEAEVLPWRLAQLQQALMRGFQDAIECSKIVEPLTMALGVLKAKLSEKIVSREVYSRFGPEAHAGYSAITGGEKVIVVHANRFRNWFSTKQQCNLVLKWLASEGLLNAGHVVRSHVGASGDWKDVSRRWPDGSLVRSFEFQDPFLEAPTPAPMAATVAKVAAAKEGTARGAKRNGIRPVASPGRERPLPRKGAVRVASGQTGADGSVGAIKKRGANPPRGARLNRPASGQVPRAAKGVTLAKRSKTKARWVTGKSFDPAMHPFDTLEETMRWVNSSYRQDKRSPRRNPMGAARTPQRRGNSRTTPEK